MARLISFIIPVKDEAQSISLLYYELIQESKKLKLEYEIIIIDDGSIDKTFLILKEIQNKDKKVKIVKLRGNFGKSIALQTGFDYSKGDIIITLDGDLQDNPKEIYKFLQKLDEGYDLVSGWKKIRHDPISKVIPSKVLNFFTSFLTGINLHDINCGFKAYKRDVILSLNLYGELYRFIPILAAKQNFNVAEITIEHRKRKFGKTKYGIERNIKGLLDLITIVFITGFNHRPGHFFGTLGLLSFLFGFIIGIYITYLRLTTGTINYRHPLLFLGMLLMIIGVQLISTGLLAEMFIYDRKQNTKKLISKLLI